MSTDVLQDRAVGEALPPAWEVGKSLDPVDVVFPPGGSGDPRHQHERVEHQRLPRGEVGDKRGRAVARLSRKRRRDDEQSGSPNQRWFRVRHVRKPARARARDAVLRRAAGFSGEAGSARLLASGLDQRPTNGALRVPRWLVTGAGGLLGHDLVAVLGRQPEVELTALGRTDLDITDAAAVEAAVAGHDVVVTRRRGPTWMVPRQPRTPRMP